MQHSSQNNFSYILDDCKFLLHLIDYVEKLIENYCTLDFRITLYAQATFIRNAVLANETIVRRLFRQIWVDEEFPSDINDKRVLALSEAVDKQINGPKTCCPP